MLLDICITMHICKYTSIVAICLYITSWEARRQRVCLLHSRVYVLEPKHFKSMHGSTPFCTVASVSVCVYIKYTHSHRRRQRVCLRLLALLLLAQGHCGTWCQSGRGAATLDFHIDYGSVGYASCI